MRVKMEPGRRSVDWQISDDFRCVSSTPPITTPRTFKPLSTAAVISTLINLFFVFPKTHFVFFPIVWSHSSVGFDFRFAEHFNLARWRYGRVSDVRSRGRGFNSRAGVAIKRLLLVWGLSVDR